MRIEPCRQDTIEEWARLRKALWPDTPVAEHRQETENLLGQHGRSCAFLAWTSDGRAVGFAEASLREDYVNGCTTSPVAFLEGIYVDPDHRRCGVARVLIGAVEDWAHGLGMSELASDAELHNSVSHRMHAALGFEETERVVYFRKALRED